MSWLRYAIIYALALLLGFVAGWVIGKRSGRAADVKVTTRVDTIRDTIPVPVAEHHVKTVEVPVYVTHIEPVEVSSDVMTIVVDTVRDTIRAEVPITQKVYRDSTYAAYVSGFRQKLDSINVYRKTVTIERIERKERKLNFGLTGGVGYGLFNRKADVWIGLGGTWKIKL